MQRCFGCYFHSIVDVGEGQRCCMCLKSHCYFLTYLKFLNFSGEAFGLKPNKGRFLQSKIYFLQVISKSQFRINTVNLEIILDEKII